MYDTDRGLRGDVVSEGCGWFDHEYDVEGKEGGCCGYCIVVVSD